MYLLRFVSVSMSSLSVCLLKENSQKEEPKVWL